MERIASFCVDHNTLVPGMYLSRKDGDVLTWDIRMKTPNKGSYLSPACDNIFCTVQLIRHHQIADTLSWK